MNKLPSDLEILNAIYDRYYPEFANAHNKWVDDSDDRLAGAYMQIDIADIAALLNVDPNIVFGRLYFYLEQKYKSREDKIGLFSLNLRGKPHWVNMPYLSSIVSELRREHGRWWWTMAFTAISVGISAISLVSSIWAVIIASR